MKCPVCGKKATSTSMITGIYEPCGHSALTKAQQRRNRRVLSGMNRVAKKVLKEMRK